MTEWVSRRETLALLAAGAALPATPGLAFVGSSFLADEESSGAIPGVDARLPKNPRVINLAELGRVPGRHGGTLRVLIGRQRDIRIMPMFGYSRLVGFDMDLNFIPDILESFEVEDSKVFTFKLREGHRWSDGNPFTAEDFRYAWEDVILHPKLPGAPLTLKPDGQLPKFEVLDELTVRYSWPIPNPDFLPALAAPSPPKIIIPSAYMKQFHESYGDADAIAARVAVERVDHWRALHTKLSRQNRPENPELPTLEPWRPRTKPPAQQFIFERNPFFHRVDENGMQLPYVDRFLLNVSSREVIPAKTATGDSDLQALNIDFSDYTILKEAGSRFPIEVRLWKRTQGSRLALYPNLTCADEVWRGVFRDVRVRRALSLGIDREKINKALFFGLSVPSANTVMQESPLYRPEYANAWVEHDPERANALLDEAGLAERGSDGMRRLPDGREAGIIVESAGESTLETDMLELIAANYREIGIGLYTRVSQRDLFRSRVLAGQVVMSVWFGLDNGVPTPELPPNQLAPTSEDNLNWPVWGVHYMSGEAQGMPPELPEAVELLDLFRAWRASTSTEQREEIWHKMLAIHADQVFSIGTVNGALQPVLRVRDLQNMPDTALYGYSPTSFLGVYMPDTFWRDIES